MKRKSLNPYPLLFFNLWCTFFIEMKLTQRIRIFPTKRQELLLWILSEKCRLLYNFALAERMENWHKNKELPREKRYYIDYLIHSKALPGLKEKYPEYKWVYSKVLQTILKKLEANYKSFFVLWKKGDKDAKPPRFKGKKYFTTLCYNQSGFKLQESSIIFSHKHPSNIVLEFEVRSHLIPQGTIKQVELFHSDERWYISLTYDVKVPEYHDNRSYQAFDLGINQTVGVNLSGNSVQFTHRRADLYWKKKIEEVQSKRDHCKRYSNKWQWYHSKLLWMIKKCVYQLKDFQHWLSNQIVSNTKANTIIVGDLKVKKMAQKKKGTGNAKKNSVNNTLNHSVHNTGYLSRFVEFLTYKAEKIGKKVIRIDESKTTKACCKCGKLEKRAIFERIIICDYGNRIDRDLNSAINIMIRFLSEKHKFDFLSHESSVNEESFLTQWNGFLRHTGQPIIEAVVHS
ncbi:MAG: RNA-guided endonuclease InsQ/TnpB family protein [Candidatus Odinarchaeota archaeon]